MIRRIHSCILSGVIGVYAAVAGAITIDFETEDDFSTSLVNGQIVDPAFDAADLEFGNLIKITATQGAGGHIGATIFDSTPGVNSDDPDLQVDLGNILILQDNQHAVTAMGANGLEYVPPDDEAARNSGSIIITVDSSPTVAGVTRPEGVLMQSIDMVDADGGFRGNVILTDIEGLMRTYTIALSSPPTSLVGVEMAGIRSA